MSHNYPDLNQRPPRSPRQQLGGFVALPRMLDKGRATIAGKNGEYHYACPLDQRFLEFTGILPDALKEQLGTGKGDGDILKWITENSPTKPDAVAVEGWSRMMINRAPADVESRQFFNEQHAKNGPLREDIVTWFDLLDLDDFVSFGGKA
jgi:hypothetical protein